jgi:RimJ/RimL family protein N-acetyltransferase
MFDLLTIQEIKIHMNELPSTDFGHVRDLFAPFDSDLFFRAVAEGNNPGQIFVDDMAQPRIGFAVTSEASLLVGDTSNLEKIRDFLQQVVFKGTIQFMETSMTLAVSPETWANKLPDLIPTHEIEPLTHYYYTLQTLSFDWRTRIPEGYEVRRIDQALLDDPALDLDEDLSWWPCLTTNWHSVSDFVNHGAGFCVLHNSQVVAQCLADYWAGDQIDLGIATHPAFRRQGLASAAAAATVDYCLRNGFKTVGWHCLAENIGSQKTAEKIGFQRVKCSTWYYYMIDPLDHLAELGWYHYKKGDAAKTVHYYENLFARRQENPDYYHHLAAAAWAKLGNVDQALHHLRRAVELGWSDAECTSHMTAFQILHDHPTWSALIASMSE